MFLSARLCVRLMYALIALGGVSCAMSDEGMAEQTMAPASDSSPLVYIPGGKLMIGSKPGMGAPDERPVHEAMVAPFEVDRNEMTTALLSAFLKAHGNECVSSHGEPVPCVDCALTDIDCNDNFSIKQNCQSEPGGPANTSCANHPARGLTWYGADTICKARGMRLLSETEWERIARGPCTKEMPPRTFPWGDGCPETFIYDGWGIELPTCLEPA